MIDLFYLLSTISNFEKDFNKILLNFVAWMSKWNVQLAVSIIVKIKNQFTFGKHILEYGLGYNYKKLKSKYFGVMTWVLLADGRKRWTPGLAGA